MNTSTEVTRKKVMLIVWRWRDLLHVNETIWKEKEFKRHIAEISQGKNIKARKDKFFQEYGVEHSDLCPDALVVTAAIYNAGAFTNDLLDTLIARYALPENELLVMLHRSNFYGEEDVDRLLKKFPGISKCFLFADGRDFIYYDTQKLGLLDHLGSFFQGHDPDTDERIAILKEHKLQQPYFDRVWDYYQNEFESKVFRLKEELFAEWAVFFLPGTPDRILRDDLIKAVREADHRVLYYRLKSFTDQYSKKIDDFDTKEKLEGEKRDIIHVEKKNGESYIFDDCIKNINHQKDNGRKFISDSYEDVCKQLNAILFDDSQTDIARSELQELAYKFNYLVKVIPGELD